MSAIQMTCERCEGRFIAGVVGRTMWPPHVCPDGTTGAPSRYGWDDTKHPTPGASFVVDDGLEI